MDEARYAALRFWHHHLNDIVCCRAGRYSYRVKRKCHVSTSKVSCLLHRPLFSAPHALLLAAYYVQSLVYLAPGGWSFWYPQSSLSQLATFIPIARTSRWIQQFCFIPSTPCTPHDSIPRNTNIQHPLAACEMWISWRYPWSINSQVFAKQSFPPRKSRSATTWYSFDHNYCAQHIIEAWLCWLTTT